MLACNSRDALNGRKNAEFFAVGAHGEILFFHIAALGFEDKTCNLEIAKTKYLGFTENVGAQVFNLVVRFEFVLEIYDVFEFADEPRIDFGEFVNTVDCVAILQRLRNRKNAEVGRVGEFVVEVGKLGVVVANKTVHTLSNHSQTLLNQFLEGATNRHNFAHRLHRRTDFAAHTGKFRQVPTRNFAD